MYLVQLRRLVGYAGAPAFRAKEGDGIGVQVRVAEREHAWACWMRPKMGLLSPSTVIGWFGLCR
jgi:hypothetical protein